MPSYIDGAEELSFNSIKVRLKLCRCMRKQSRRYRFNSIKVRLKQGNVGVPSSDDDSFNSIKVRLKLIN